MNKNIIKKITATALCGVLALTSVVTANSAVKVKAVTDVGNPLHLRTVSLGQLHLILIPTTVFMRNSEKKKADLQR